MATLVKDTHKLINFLQSKGYSKQQAEGFVEAVKEFETADLVTKSDLKAETQTLRADLYRYIFGVAVGQVALTVALIQL